MRMLDLYTDDKMAEALRERLSNLTEEERGDIAQGLDEIEYFVSNALEDGEAIVEIMRETAIEFVNRYEMDPNTMLTPTRALMWRLVLD